MLSISLKYSYVDLFFKVSSLYFFGIQLFLSYGHLNLKGHGICDIYLNMRYFINTALWASLYLFIVVAPLFVLLLGFVPPSRGFWWELSSALGFLSISVMGMQFTLTARFKRATAPFGIDIIYHFHKYIGITALTFIIIHPAGILLSTP